MRKRIYEKGNVLIYILIAIALIGFLTVTLSRQNQQSDSQNIDEETITLHTLKITEHAQTMKNVVSQMEMTGSNFATIDFINPVSTGFNTAPHIHKIYHPQGGGMSFKSAGDYPSGIFLSGSGWQFNDSMNVEWTESSADDLVFTALDISEDVCNKINAQIRDDISTPPVATVTAASIFAYAATTDLTNITCPNCEGYQTLCLEDSAGDFAFYTVMINR